MKKEGVPPMKDTQKLCAQIKTNGEQCEAYHLTDDTLCYFHSRDRQRQMVIARYHRARISRLNIGMPADETHKLDNLSDQVYNESQAVLLAALELPALEDANAISVTATNILRLIAFQQIDHKSAALMLYGLQIVSGILGKLRTQPSRFRPAASCDPEPLAELAAMLADLRARKKAAASAAAESASGEDQEREKPNSEELAPTGTES